MYVMKRTAFWYITPCSPVEFTDVSEEITASIFKVNEQAKEETSLKNKLFFLRLQPAS
jgi:hypothetical protein